MDNTPILIGAANIQQKNSLDKLDEALILMDKAFKLAARDSSPKITKYIDEIRVPKGFWKYRDPGAWIAEKNNFLNKPTTYVSKIGVLQQTLINEAIKKIMAGDINASLIIGGESRYKLVQSLKANKEYKETKLIQNPDHYLKAQSDLNLPEEIKELSHMAVGYYAILENALRHKNKNSVKQHKKIIADLYEGFSEIASQNKDSLISKKIKSHEISESSKMNPYQAFPYNKYHCTSWNVNQASALIICNKRIADKLEIPEAKRIYPLAASETNYMNPLIQRESMLKPLGMKLAAKFIIDQLNKFQKNVDFYDLYSCFPVAVQMFAESLNIKPSKSSTITGGMSFAGGPLNHYVLTSTVQMIDKLRNKPNSIGLITGVSGVMTKQSYALWSSEKITNFSHKDVTSQVEKLDIPMLLSHKKSGEAKIVSYTILKDKKNYKKKAVIYAETKNKKRLILSSQKKEFIKDMERNEWIGKDINFKNGSLV
mgnify:FL=1